MATLFGVVVFANRVHSPELQLGVAASFIARHAGAYLLFCLQSQVLLHLFMQPRIASPPGREVKKACE